MGDAQMADGSGAGKAAMWMMGAVLGFSAMAIAGREVSHLHDTFEIMAVRSAVGLGLVLSITALRGRLSHISPRNLSGHILRNIVHFTGQNLWFLGLTMIPLAQLFAIEFSAPLWVLIFAPFLLGERFTAMRFVAAGVGFAGILIVTRPFTEPMSLGVLLAAGAAVCFALTGIVTKRLTRDVSIESILFWLTFLQLIFGLTAAFWDGEVHIPDATTLPWLVLIGAAGLLAHLSLTSALRLAPASYVMPIDFLRLPLIAVVGALVYGEALDPYVLLGGGVVVFGAWLNLWSEKPARKRRLG
jgi:drug/metabolite transporter (DMT)-like permease